jgi:hypothetical protein
MAMTMSTTRVITAPTPLITNPPRQPGSRSRRWWRAMPAWESVNEVKTPMA